MERKDLESGMLAETEIFERHAPCVAQAPHSGLPIFQPSQARFKPMMAVPAVARDRRDKAEEKVPTVRRRESLDEVVH